MTGRGPGFLASFAHHRCLDSELCPGIRTKASACWIEASVMSRTSHEAWPPLNGSRQRCACAGPDHAAGSRAHPDALVVPLPLAGLLPVLHLPVVVGEDRPVPLHVVPAQGRGRAQTRLHQPARPCGLCALRCTGHRQGRSLVPAHNQVAKAQALGGVPQPGRRTQSPHAA